MTVSPTGARAGEFERREREREGRRRRRREEGRGMEGLEEKTVKLHPTSSSVLGVL